MVVRREYGLEVQGKRKLRHTAWGVYSHVSNLVEALMKACQMLGGDGCIVVVVWEYVKGKGGALNGFSDAQLQTSHRIIAIVTEEA